MVHRYVRENDHGFTIQVNFIVTCVWGGLEPMVFVTDRVIAKWLVNIGRKSLVAWDIRGQTQLGY